MKKTNISYLKQQLSSCLKEVREGEEYIILDRKTPVAVLQPYKARTEEGERDRWVAEGLLRPASDPQLLDLPPPVKMKGPPLSKLIDQERNGR